MKILFVHQNFPAQFLHLAPALTQRGHVCQVLTDLKNAMETQTPTLKYKHEFIKPDPAAVRLGRNFTMNSDRGVTVARTCIQIAKKYDYTPDVIFGHSGWGETLFLKEVWPTAKLLIYSEFYYRGVGQDSSFDPEFQNSGFDHIMSAQARTAHLGMSMIHSDAAVCPTKWQASTHPPLLRKNLEVIFDGINTDVMVPNPDAAITLPNGRVLRAGDEILTFVNRNLEPYRGYHSFMRALPDIMAARPEAQVVIVGGDGVSYGIAAPAGKTWKQIFLDEVADRIDPSRVHFLGKVSYPSFVTLMQVSRAHAYLTYPFVLSWSMLEAMSAGALVVGSRTAPVEELIDHGANGLLVDFFDIKAWSETLIDALANPQKYQPLRDAARKTIVDGYDLKTICLPRMVEWVESFAPPA